MDTKATQTEEEGEEDYSHLTAKDINFKQCEGIQAKLRRFEAVNKDAFILELDIDGKKFSGWLIEATDSFAPVNLIPSKRRSRAYKKSIARHFRGQKNKKPVNVYSRENYPRGYVDTFNTIEARLRHGRDKNIPGSSTSSAPGSSSSQSNINASSTSNRNKKSLNSATASDSNYQSSFSKRKYKRKRRYIKGNLEHIKCDKAPEALSNDNSSLTCSVLMTASTPICNKSKNSKQEDDDTRAGLSDTFCSIETNMRCSPCKNKEKQTTTDLLCSDSKSGDLDRKYALGFVTSSPSNNIKAQSKNDCVVQMAASSQVSWSSTLEPEIIILSPGANTGNQLKEDLKINESSALNKAESLHAPVVELVILSPETNPRKLLKNDHDTFERAVLNKDESPHPQVLELIIFSPEENTKKIVVKNEDTFDESAAVIKAESPELPVLDLMIFSPEANTGKTPEKNDSVESAALSKIESLEPPVLDLMIFSPEMNTATQSMPDTIQRPPIIQVPNNKYARSNLQATLANGIVLDCDCIEVPCSSSGIISPKFSQKKLTRRPPKNIQRIKGDNPLMTNENTFNYVTESNMQNTPERKVINNSTSILENAASNKDMNSSSKLEFLHVNGINLSNDMSIDEISNLNAVQFPNKHVKYPDCYEESVCTSLGIDSEKTPTEKFRQRFELIPNTQNISDRTKRNTFEDMHGSVQFISQNTLKEGKVRSYSDKTGKRREKKRDNNLSEPSFLEKYAIRSTNDNADFEEVMSKPVIQNTSGREILISSNDKETELFYSESIAQNAISAEGINILLERYLV